VAGRGGERGEKRKQEREMARDREKKSQKIKKTGNWNLKRFGFHISIVLNN